MGVMRQVSTAQPTLRILGSSPHSALLGSGCLLTGFLERGGSVHKVGERGFRVTDRCLEHRGGPQPALLLDILQSSFRPSSTGLLIDILLKRELS